MPANAARQVRSGFALSEAAEVADRVIEREDDLRLIARRQKKKAARTMIAQRAMRGRPESDEIQDARSAKEGQ